MYNRNELLKDLRENVMEVFFTKVNGEERHMKCTLMPGLLPPNADLTHLEEAHKKAENQSVIACWDLEKAAWRSFRVDSVKMVQLLDAYHYL